MAITLGLVESVDDDGVYVSMPGSRGVLRGPYEIVNDVAVGSSVLLVGTDDGEQVAVGVVTAPPRTGVFNVRDYGAKGDGTTDDTAAVEAAIAAAQGGAAPGYGAGGATVLFPRGEYLITDTIRVDRFTGMIVGTGTGNSPECDFAPSNGSVIRWGGSAAIPMLRFDDYRNVFIDNLRFEGSNSAPPSYAILGQYTSGYSAGSNIGLHVSNCYIGNYPWSSQGLNKGDVTNGVGFTGNNGMNDRWRLTNCWVRAVEIGLHAPNSQSIWGLVDHTTFYSCGVSGISSGASFTGSDIHFDNCTVDVTISAASTRVAIHGWWSERSYCIYDLYAGAALAVRGGLWQVRSPRISTGSSINAENVVENDVSIEDVRVDYQDFGADPWPTLYLHGGASSWPYWIRVHGCRNLNSATLDVEGSSTAGRTYVDISSGDVQIRRSVGVSPLTTYLAPAITGSRGGNTALASLLTELAAQGLITDSTT